MLIPVGVVMIVLAAVGVYLLLDRRQAMRVAIPILVVLALLAAAGYGLHRWKGVRLSDIAFGLSAVVAVFSAFSVVTHEKVLFSALYFIVLVVATAVLVLLLGAQFLAAALVLIYAGAIIVVYIFVIMLAQEPGWPKIQINPGRVILGAIAAAVLAGAMVMLRGPNPLPAAPWDQSNVARIGQSVLIDYVITLEVAGVLLLSALIGAVALAKTRSPRRSDDEP